VLVLAVVAVVVVVGGVDGSGGLGSGLPLGLALGLVSGGTLLAVGSVFEYCAVLVGLVGTAGGDLLYTDVII
jgi:hypothetical protein